MSATLSTTHVPEFLKLLAHELRWNIVTVLAQSDRSVHEIIQALHEPQNVVSYHLRKLREHHLIKERRSSADERSLYYSLDLEVLRTLYLNAGNVLHPAIGSLEVPADPQQWPMSQRPLRVLFLCTHNSARSVLAEALLRQMSSGRVEVASAGTEPTGIHPTTMQVLASLDVDHTHLRSKHIDELSNLHFDYVITVCDRVREACPTWPAEAELIHWSFPDPVQEDASEEERYQALEHTATQLTTRIRYFLTLVERRYRHKTLTA
ncbi:ArsR family transcriptional regulator [Dictyobacter alpinus]|uniref:ArsR family transcriptional regulator n=1 Tax=Dictyobacter alpinus TaxID=2014873 RepID=A0A402BER7_9CHLR|nr:helix-turn-helix domain-containing protein [Dictyobacter alpinus]GCE29884.1 ArsR family transcriptional regulator [Dictyobacter alpinus]